MLSRILTIMVIFFACWLNSVAFADSTFIGTFVDDSNSPHPVNITISDGNWVQEYADVTTLNVTVPQTATYTYEYTKGEKTMMNRVNLTIPDGESREFTFHILGTVQERLRPYVAIEESDANAALTWSYDSNSHQLTWSIDQEGGKIVDVIIQIDSNLTDGSKFALTQCAANGQTWGVDLPASAWWNRQSVMSAHNQVTGFGQIPTDLVAVGFRDMVINDFTVRPETDIVFDSVLTDISGTVISPQYLYPQYALTPGYYLVRPTDLPDGCVELALPLYVRSGRPEILELYPAFQSSVLPYSFYLLAENYFTHTSITQIQHKPDHSVVVSLTGMNNFDRWGYFVVPESYEVNSIVAALKGGAQIDLTVLYDYTVTVSNNLKFVTIRVDSDTETVTLIPVPLSDIPAISEWGLIILALLMVTAGAIAIRRRLQAAA